MEQVIEHRHTEVNLGVIADRETDTMLKELHAVEWQILRERIYNSMAAAIKWQKEHGYLSREERVMLQPPRSGEDEEHHTAAVPAFTLSEIVG